MGDYKSCQTTSAKLCTRYGKIGERRIKKQASSKRKVCQKNRVRMSGLDTKSQFQTLRKALKNVKKMEIKNCRSVDNL